MSCHWCGGQLKPPKRKFCSDRCRRLYGDSACNPWHKWVFDGFRTYKVRKLPGPVNGGY